MRHCLLLVTTPLTEGITARAKELSHCSHKRCTCGHRSRATASVFGPAKEQKRIAWRRADTVATKTSKPRGKANEQARGLVGERTARLLGYKEGAAVASKDLSTFGRACSESTDPAPCCAPCAPAWPTSSNGLDQPAGRGRRRGDVGRTLRETSVCRLFQSSKPGALARHRPLREPFG